MSPIATNRNPQIHGYRRHAHCFGSPGSHSHSRRNGSGRYSHGARAWIRRWTDAPPLAALSRSRLLKRTARPPARYTTPINAHTTRSVLIARIIGLNREPARVEPARPPVGGAFRFTMSPPTPVCGRATRPRVVNVVATPIERLKQWARPRRWAIIGGLSPLLAALLAFGVATHDWLLTAGGFVGLLIGWSLVILIVMYPALWEPANRWRFFLLFVAVGTTVVVLFVSIVFLLT
jgi:hypothetical protein